MATKSFGKIGKNGENLFYILLSRSLTTPQMFMHLWKWPVYSAVCPQQRKLGEALRLLPSLCCAWWNWKRDNLVRSQANYWRWQSCASQKTSFLNWLTQFRKATS